MSLSARMSPAAGMDEDAAEFAADVLAGLSGAQKSLPSHYFYDAQGSALFEAITRLPEYYPTRVETAILAAHAGDMAGDVPDGALLVEFGSGSSRKTEILLAAMPEVEAYVPIDVSAAALQGAERRLAARFPRLGVRPIAADFTQPVDLPTDLAGRPKVGFFPGSTIGNFEPRAARRLLAHFRKTLGDGSRLILGVDLVKDEATLLKAYNDAAGVTAAFNLNLLARINRTFGHTFDLGAFSHAAIYNRQRARIEMHLVSRRAQTVRLLGRTLRFAPGETIHTENSHKYTRSGIQCLALSAGWRPGRLWTDAAGLFCVSEMTA